MAHVKKRKLHNLEKLRKILDNPYDPNTKKILASGDTLLDSVRRRLLYETGGVTPKPLAATTRISSSLEPTVTIRLRIPTIPSTQTAASLPEFMPVSTSQGGKQPSAAEGPSFETQDLIEIERVETAYPEFTVVGPAEMSVTVHHEEEAPSIDKTLPEWQPVEESQLGEPFVPPQKPPKHKEEPPGEEIPEFERLESKTTTTETQGQPVAWEAAPETSGEETQPEPPTFHIIGPAEPEARLTRSQRRAQKKAEKQKEKEAKRQKKIEEKRVKKETRQKEKEATQLARTQQLTTEPSTETPPPEPAPAIEQPPTIKVDLSAFKGMESIDEHTGELLYRRGYFSLDDLKNATIEDLVQIRGIRRKLAKKIKKELEQKTTPTHKEEEFVPIKKRVSAKQKRVKPKDVTEWESFSVNNSEEMPTPPPATRGKYTLYKKEMGRGKKKTTIHFFSKETPAKGTPAPLPEGYRIAVNKRTKVPYLKKKK